MSGHLEDLRLGGDGTAIKRYELRRNRLGKTGIEVREIFWHPWEILKDFGSKEVEPYTEKALKEFLMRIESDPVVEFSSVQQAASDWMKYHEVE